MRILFRIKHFFKKLMARTLITKETTTPLLYCPYNNKSTYYIINNNKFHMYNNVELYKLYTTTRKDPITHEPIHTQELVIVKSIII